MNWNEVLTLKRNGVINITGICSGSIKYLSTGSKGIILLTDLVPNTTYYINAKGKIGLLEINNHYDIKAQTFTSGPEGEIKEADIILK